MATICMLVAPKKHKLCQPAWWQTRSGGSHYKAWLAEDSLTGCRAAWCREELQSKRLQNCKRIIIKQMQSNWTTVRKWKGLKNLFKCPLVNETLWPETETRPRRLAFSLRRDRDLPTLCWDRDVWKICLETVSRPRRRDRDYNSGHREMKQNTPVIVTMTGTRQPARCNFFWRIGPILTKYHGWLIHFSKNQTK